MKLIIHDLQEKEFSKLFRSLPTDDYVISPSQGIHSCLGCFGCWIQNPSYCVIPDEGHQIGDLLAKATDVIIISRCCYGGFSPQVKRVLDRFLPYMLPYLEVTEGRMRHTPRYENRFNVSANFYGEMITPEEETIAHRIVDELTFDMNGTGCSVSFYRDKSGLKGIAL